jgi:hypothetical protein
MSDIVYSGVTIAAIFMPVYFSIFLDKIRDIKLSKVAPAQLLKVYRRP